MVKEALLIVKKWHQAAAQVILSLSMTKILCRIEAGGVDELKRFLMIFLQAAKNPANKREIALPSRFLDFEKTTRDKVS